MKLSNFLLSIVACGMFGMAVGASSLVVSIQPTTVISVPAEEGMTGGGFSMKLPSSLTHKQAELLAMAYDIAKHDGHKYPQLLQGIILQESKAGDLASYKVAGQEFGLKPNERYYGVAQIKLIAAREVLGRYPGMKDEFEFHTSTDEEVIAKLIENDRFNISIASKYLLVLKSMGYDTMKQLALAYNQGAGGARSKDADTNPYSRGVMAQIQSLIVPAKSHK
jgi:hypothetical protein